MKLSIFLPMLRPHLLEKMYQSIEQSCSRHSWELVVVGPFSPTDDFLAKSNVIFQEDWGHPTRAAQIAASLCTGELLYHTVDDCLFLKNSISDSIDQYHEQCQSNDMIGMRYTEGIGYSGNELALEDWTIGNNPEYKTWPNVELHWVINVHFIMNRLAFKEWGGFYCGYEYLNQAGAHLELILQRNGHKIYQSPKVVSLADHVPGRTGDHAPINDSQLMHDYPLFKDIWRTQPDTRYEFCNWECHPDVWERRFGKVKPKSYEEMYNN